MCLSPEKRTWYVLSDVRAQAKRERLKGLGRRRVPFAGLSEEGEPKLDAN